MMNCSGKSAIKCRGKISIYRFLEMVSQALELEIRQFVRRFGRVKAFWKFQRNMNCRNLKYIRFSKAGSNISFIIFMQKYNILLYDFTNNQYIVVLSYGYEIPYMTSRLGINGNIFNDIKELRRHYGTTFRLKGELKNGKDL